MKFTSTQYTLSFFRDRYTAKELELKPPYQRLPVWAAKQKSSLIESILLDLPVPEVYVLEELVEQKKGEPKSMYYVVDGQQRIRSVLQFLGIDRDPMELDFNNFALEKLEDGSPFKGINYAGLSKEQRDGFLQYPFAVRLLRNADDAAVRDMFKRLNKFLTKLNDQELRNATYTGPFIQVAYTLAENKYWLESGLLTPTQVRRMKDIEFVSELLIGVISGPQGGSPKSIDEYYTLYEDYDDEFPGQKSAVLRFQATLTLTRRLIPDTEDSRFHTNRTDFYTLFVACAQLLTTHQLPKTKHASLKAKLGKFEREVDARLANDTYDTSETVIRYARAAQKGVNDKARRAERHAALLEIITPYFKRAKA